MPLASSPRVFLSYARKDGEDFATALRRRLSAEEPQITLWQDRAEMEGGVGWWTQIEAALDQARFLVIVLTPEAIASGITQQEWRYARQRGVVVYPVKGVPDQRLDYAALPNWMRKVHFFDIGQFTRGEWRESKEWETFVSYLKSDREPNRVPFMAPDLPAGFVPRERERDQLLQLLLEPRGGKPVAATAALIGAGGYGKTTLAIALCHDERVIEAFDDGVLWTSLGETPRLVDELTKLYEALTGQRPAFVDATQAAASLAGKLEHRNCLLVIDDVWERVHLDPFLKGGKQCARLVTTRRFDLAHGAARVRVNEMSAEESLRMLGTAFSPGAISDARLAPMARRLGEWPLLLKLAAGMIGRRLDRGDSADGALAYVEQVLDKRGVTAFDQDNATQRDEAVRRTVGASLDQLSVEDARRFHDLAIFPEDTRIPLTTLQRLWGLDALDAADCAQRLDDVSLLSLDLPREVIVLHDMMRAYLVQTLDDAARVQARLVAAYQDLEHLPDLYAWRWLPYHMREAGQIADLRELLLRPAWLHAKLRATSPDALIGDFDFVPGDGDLDAVQAALRLALSSLAADPNQLWEQLLGRLPLALSPRLERLRRDLTRSAPRPRLHARWPNLQGPGGGLLQTLVGHRESINGARLLPDGRVLSWSCDDTLRIWDLTTGENLALIGHQGIVLGALVLPDGRVLSWSEDATLRVWDLATGEALALTGHRRLVRRALLLPDGRVVSSSDDSTLRIWDLATGQARTLSGHRGRVFEALLLPDGRVLSRSEDGTLRVWDLPTGESHTLSGHEGLVLGALLLPDGAVLSWSDDTTLRVWNPTTGEGRALTGHEGPVRGALRLLDGCVLSWAEEPLLRIWNLATGEGRALSGHEWQSVGGALLLPDGRVLSWSADGTRMWNPATGESRAVTGHQGSVSGALLLPDGRVLSWGDGYILRVEDIATGEGSSLIGHEKSITGAALLPSGRVLSWSADQTLKLWEVGMGLGGAVTGHHRPVEGALLLQAGRMLSWSRDSLRVCDLTTGESHPVLTSHDFIKGAVLLPDQRVALWTWNSLCVCDLVTGRALTIHQNGIDGVLLLIDGRVLSWRSNSARIWNPFTNEGHWLGYQQGSISGARQLSNGRVLFWGSRTLWVWDLATDKGRKLRGHGDVVSGAAPMPDGRVLSWSRDRTLRVWDLATGEGRSLKGHQDFIDGALPLPEQHVVSWSSHSARIWNVASGKSRELTPKGGFTGAFLMPDGRLLSWGKESMLRVWDLATHESRALTGHTRSVRGVLLLPDGALVSWSEDRSVRWRFLDGDEQGLAFYFDAIPTAVVPDGTGGLLVGDALGRIHFLERLV